METWLALYTQQVIVFVLVLARVSGLLTLAPVWSSRAIPVRVRAFLAVGLALIITPLQWHVPVRDAQDVLHIGLLLAGEFLVGLALGLAVMIYFAGLELAGQVLGQMSGMSLAEVVSPTYDAPVPVFSEFLNFLMISVFLLTGGHLYLLDALFQAFAQMPPGQTHISASLVQTLTDITTYSFTMGLQIAAPVMVALLLAIVLMGLISRTLPQLNVLALGFSANSTVMLAALLLSLGVLTRVFQEQSLAVIDWIRPVLTRG